MRDADAFHASRQSHLRWHPKVLAVQSAILSSNDSIHALGNPLRNLHQIEQRKAYFAFHQTSRDLSWGRICADVVVAQHRGLRRVTDGTDTHWFLLRQTRLLGNYQRH